VQQKSDQANGRKRPDVPPGGALSINDLLFMGEYAEVVRRVDTWHQWTSAALPVVLIKLADALRPTLTSGTADPMDRRECDGR
jgi:hypothetical protein